jgi:hypothetical protein
MNPRTHVWSFEAFCLFVHALVHDHLFEICFDVYIAVVAYAAVLEDVPYRNVLRHVD